MPPLEIRPLDASHLPEAAALVAARYAGLRRSVPQLPAAYAEPATLLPLLHDMIGRAPGAVALRDGRLVGFLTAYLLDHFRGRPAAFSPEWANGAVGEGGRAIYEALYAAMCRVWLAAGRSLHGVCLFAGDPEVSEGWRWLGFGLAAADALRDLSPPAAPGPGLRITRAGLAELAQVAALDGALQQHLLDAPVCLVLKDQTGHDDLVAELADPEYAFWVAWDGDEAVGFMKFGPASHSACTVIIDPATASITGAYTRPRWRGRGVAAALLARGLAWADACGYARCSVDFEPMNTAASRFWLGHFQLICLSHLRYLDERLLI